MPAAATVQNHMSCRDESAGYLARELQCARLTPVASVPWSAIFAHGCYPEHRRKERATPTEISLNPNDAFCGRSLRGSLQFFGRKNEMELRWNDHVMRRREHDDVNWKRKPLLVSA